MQTTRTIELDGIEFKRHPDNLEALLKIDINDEPFNFQQSLNIDTINNESKCIDRKAHLFWENPVIDAKINDLMSTLSKSGKAAARLVMTVDCKKKLELSFVDSLFMMFKLQERLARIQSTVKVYNSVQQYTHNFGEFIFYKSMNLNPAILRILLKPETMHYM